MSAERAVQKPLRPRDIGRLNAFTDGIIVVSMTLLVLDIRLPEHLSDHDGAELLHALVELWPKFFGYALSFLVIAQYWLGYTEEFGDMEAADSTFARLNILLLLFIGLIPFTTTLISSNDGMVATSLYALSMIAVCATLSAMWIYAAGAGLVAAPEGRRWLPILPWVHTAAVFAISIVVAQFSPTWGKLTWLLLALPIHSWLRRILS